MKRFKPAYKVGDKVVLIRHDYLTGIDDIIGKSYTILRVNTGSSSYWNKDTQKATATCWYGFTDTYNAPEQYFVPEHIYNSKLYRLLNEDPL